MYIQGISMCSCISFLKVLSFVLFMLVSVRHTSRIWVSLLSVKWLVRWIQSLNIDALGWEGDLFAIGLSNQCLTGFFSSFFTNTNHVLNTHPEHFKCIILLILCSVSLDFTIGSNTLPS